MRLAFWNLDGLGQPNKQARDYGRIAQVMNRFDIIAIQGLTTIKDLDGLIAMLNATGASKWSRLGGGDGPQSAPSVIWRTERIAYDNFVRATPLTTSTSLGIHPLLIARLRFAGRPFYLSVIDVHEKARTLDPITIAERHLASLVKHSAGVPVFLGVSLEEGLKPQFLEPLAKSMRPVYQQQPTTIGTTKRAMDMVFTSYTRPVKAGVFPFHKLMALDPKTAVTTVSGRLPSFALTTLEQ